jgi:hypothetical protein
MNKNVKFLDTPLAKRDQKNRPTPGELKNQLALAMEKAKLADFLKLTPEDNEKARKFFAAE